MKILAIGDFHGEFSKKWNVLIKKEKIDLVVSNGDYFPFYYRKVWFEHCYGKEVELWEVLGKDKVKKMILKDLKMGEHAIKGLNGVSVPVVSVFGNVDYTRVNDQFDEKKLAKGKNWKWEEKDFFSPIMKKYKNIKRVDYRYIRVGNYVIIGAYGGSNRGHVKSKAYKKHREILDELFKKFRKENQEGKVIFVSHNVPYDTKLDELSMKAHEKVKGKHLGSKLVRRIIDKWQPIVHVGGHIHEAKGKDKLGRTLCVNPGAAHEGNAAVIDLSGKEVKVKFVRKYGSK